MQILSVMIYALIVITAIILVVLILMQPSKSGGLGSAFGGGGTTEAVFGAHALSHLSKLTIIFISIFFVLTLGLAIIAAHSQKGDDKSLMGDTVPVAEEVVVEEVPGTGAVVVDETVSVPAAGNESGVAAE